MKINQTLQLIAERLGCEPDALAICEAITRLKKQAMKNKKLVRRKK